MPDLSVDADSIERAATELQTVADDLDGIVGPFAQALSQYGDPWGMDMLGMLIGGGYVAIEQLAFETLDSIVDCFDADAEGLTSMAASYRDVEDSNDASFDRFHREL